MVYKIAFWYIFLIIIDYSKIYLQEQCQYTKIPLISYEWKIKRGCLYNLMEKPLKKIVQIYVSQKNSIIYAVKQTKNIFNKLMILF